MAALRDTSPSFLKAFTHLFVVTVVAFGSVVAPTSAQIPWPEPPQGEFTGGEIGSLIQPDNENGLFGIGTGVPAARLDIFGKSGRVVLIADSINGDGGNCAVGQEKVFLDPTGIAAGFEIDGQAIVSTGANFVCTESNTIAWNNGDEKWWKDPASQSVIDESGQFGINTASPVTNLDANGNVVIVGDIPGGWYDEEYGYRKKLTIDKDLVGGGDDLANYPILVSITDNDLKTTGNGGRVQSASGYDIIFTDSSNTTLLAHEIEVYNPASGSIEMWVSIPTLSVSDDTEFYLYYGKSGVDASQENAAAVWSAYEAVWHFNNNFTDSANDHDGTNNGSVDDAGVVSRARDFSDDWVRIPDDGSTLDSAINMTASAWIKPEAAFSSYNKFLAKGNAMSDISWSMDINTNTIPRPQINFYNTDSDFFSNVSDTEPVTDGSTWYHVAGVKTDADISVFIDGQENESYLDPFEGTLRDATGGLYIGSSINGWANRFDGDIDEVRIAKTNLTSGWIETEYNTIALKGSGAGKFIKSVDNGQSLAEFSATVTVFQIASGNVGIGTANASAKLDVVGTSELNGDTEITGDLNVNGNAGGTSGWTQSSDLSLKANIRPLTGLDTILKLNGVRFDWKASGTPAIGVIAQEVEKVFPEVVRTDSQGLKSVDYASLVAPLIEAVKELKAKNTELKHRITLLKSKAAEKSAPGANFPSRP